MGYQKLKDTKNFKISEFKCKCGRADCIGVPDEDGWAYGIQGFQRFRNWYSRPMKVNSGYRCDAHNRKVGGAGNSQHKVGVAADFALPEEYLSFSLSRKKEFRRNVEEKWWTICKEDGCGGGVGWYEPTEKRRGFFHLDRRSVKTKWDG